MYGETVSEVDTVLFPLVLLLAMFIAFMLFGVFIINLVGGYRGAGAPSNLLQLSEAALAYCMVAATTGLFNGLHALMGYPLLGEIGAKVTIPSMIVASYVCDAVSLISGSGVGRGHAHEPVAARGRHRLAAGLGDGVVGAGEGDAVDNDQPAGPPGHVHALPQRQRAHQAGVLVGGKGLHERGQLVLALGVDGQVRGAAQDPGGLLGGAPGGEQAEQDRKSNV